MAVGRDGGLLFGACFPSEFESYMTFRARLVLLTADAPLISAVDRTERG